MRSNSLAAAWDQVRAGGYVDCAIGLMVDGAQYDGQFFIWDAESSLFIKTASLHFTRKPIDKPVPRKGWFTRS
jgi:hypothetical protein